MTTMLSLTTILSGAILERCTLLRPRVLLETHYSVKSFLYFLKSDLHLFHSLVSSHNMASNLRFSCAARVSIIALQVRGRPSSNTN